MYKFKTIWFLSRLLDLINMYEIVILLLFKAQNDEFLTEAEVNFRAFSNCAFVCKNRFFENNLKSMHSGP